MLAVIAFAAGDVMEDDDTVARSKLPDSSPDGGYFSRSFVPKDARSRMRASGDLLEVGTADSASVNPQKKLSRTDLRNGDGFKADVVYPAVNRGQHVSRD